MKSAIAAAVMIFVLIAYFAGGFTGTKTVYVSSQPDFVKYQNAGSRASASAATIIVPAVDDNGNGVATTLSVQVSPGAGRLLINIERVVFWADTQNSIRTAKAVAEAYTKADLSSYDIEYAIGANASVVEGPSAGAALAVATIAAVKNLTINTSVMMTGTINPDGSIGQIGDALAKARAAKQMGAQLFLVPKGQSSETKQEQKKTCSTESGVELCKVETVTATHNIASEAGIAVVEVSNLGQAAEYFF
jgi:uncharacterized protein